VCCLPESLLGEEFTPSQAKRGGSCGKIRVWFLSCSVIHSNPEEERLSPSCMGLQMGETRFMCLLASFSSGDDANRELGREMLNVH